jgi:hypothetical protein
MGGQVGFGDDGGVSMNLQASTTPISGHAMMI